MKEPIVVYQYQDAPEELKDLTTPCDKDWIAIIPPNLANNFIGWLEEGSAFGCCDVQEFNHPTLEGYKVRIGAHA